MITLRNAEEGRIILSRIEEQVGLDKLADWIVEGATRYKENPELHSVCISDYITKYCEERYRDNRHPIKHHTYYPEEREI